MSDVMKATPGPWVYDGESRIDAVAQRKPTGHMVTREDGTEFPYLGGLVALPYGCRTDDDEGVGDLRANAYLIAAAPDLLAALQDLLSDESPVWAWVNERGIGKDEYALRSARIESARAAVAKAVQS